MAFSAKSVDEVRSWLTDNGFAEYAGKFHENQIDGEALLSLTERASEILVPVMGHRMKFLKLMKNVPSEESTTTVRPLEDSSSEVEEVEKRSATTSKDPQTPQQTR